VKDVYSSKWASHVESQPPADPARCLRERVSGRSGPASHVTWTELRRIVRELRIGPGGHVPRPRLRSGQQQYCAAAAARLLIEALGV